MMKKIALSLLPFTVLMAACGEEPAPEPAPAETVAPEPIESLPAPDQELFATLHAAACPEAKPVNTAVCRRAGMGSEDVICEYGLGDDEYLRNTATLTAGDGEWVLTDTETVCAAGA
ncbi:hypothetical protein SAMN06297468_0305 [Altererythrobacter xiamenensis]|uniref:Lipoprotein n=2 Tax=Altererythrobacter xiamenensis TaxID=1316679 RepID=A0A1Y6EG55_9SPHN|nr:hypothetical protein SAMN06297468_0305 [Altererythrobacter xiamenensis]